MEQNEYNKEKIIWKNIPFSDNQGVLDMIGIKPMNIMSLIDEESKFPKGMFDVALPYRIFYEILCLLLSTTGTDNTFLLKLNRNHSPKSIFVRSLNDYDSSFGIRHFAGVVMYNSRGIFSIIFTNNFTKFLTFVFCTQVSWKRIVIHSVVI